MKVYYQGKSTNHHLYVTPGIEFPETSCWFDVNKKPIMFDVNFVNNVAEVEDNLGRYLIDQGLAVKHFSRIITRVTDKIKEAIL
jgi:hypothetical protein